MRSESVDLKSESLKKINSRVTSCQRCPRLRRHCEQVAVKKRKQFQDEKYWGLPVPGFGDSNPKLLIVGLAPAAHGANRTGRMFTGDNSGLWLYRALFRAGFSSRPESLARDDGLELKSVYITNAVRCAPPLNKPNSAEIQNCDEYLTAEMAHFADVRVYLALGQIALKTLWSRLPAEVKPQPSLPKFRHGLVVGLRDGKKLVCSYHPSQQNTFTKRLTEPMFDAIFQLVQQFII